MLEVNEPQRELYLAIPVDAYESFFQRRLARVAVERNWVKLLVYDPVYEETDSDVGEELVAMGVPKEDIVLGLQPPYKRPYTGYGTGYEPTKA